MGVYAGRHPYGDIYSIPTSAVDNIANRLYREQQIRQQQKLAQDKALDDEFAKNVAGVKSADIPEITKAYSDFKQAHINLQKKGQKATPQDQMDVMIKKANAFQAINASKEDKARLTQYGTMVKSDPKGLYDPNAHNMINTWLNTPTSQRNLDEDSKLKYQYAMPNIDKEIANAAGKGQEIELPVGVDEKDPLKDKVEVYKTINPPNVFYNNLFTGLAARSDNKGFVRSVMDNLTDEEKDKLRTAYEVKIQDPKFKALYGEVQPFPASAANTDLGQAVALKTMEAVVNLPIDKIKDKSVINADRQLTRKRAEGMADWKLKEGIRQAGRKELLGMREAAKQAGEDTYDLWIDRHISGLEEDAKNSTIKSAFRENGKTVYENSIPVDAVTAKVFSRDGSEPDKLTITADGKYRPIFYKRDNNGVAIKDGKDFTVNETLSTPISRDQFKLLLGGKVGVKQLNKEMTVPTKNNATPVKKGKYD